MQRIPSNRPFLSLALLSFALAGTSCTALDSAEVSEQPEEVRAPDERKLQAAKLELELGRARLKLEIAQKEAAELKHKSQLMQAEAEVGIAEANSTHFREIEAPNRLARERLDLRTAKDRAQEAADELAQIQIMYEDQDLDDLTAEFVVSRGKSNAERAAARIAIQAKELQGLEQHELPQEAKRLELEQRTAREKLEQLRLEGVNSAEARAISIEEARGKVLRLEGELEDLTKGDA